ncbi:MAG: hypothetical protein IPJ34_42470 [Myxococcales bacterium]|nr:hypothetical protein [Myxococcales bacterium]
MPAEIALLGEPGKPSSGSSTASVARWTARRTRSSSTCCQPSCRLDSPSAGAPMPASGRKRRTNVTRIPRDGAERRIGALQFVDHGGRIGRVNVQLGAAGAALVEVTSGSRRATSS